MWGALEEEQYQILLKNYQEFGDREIKFNNVIGPLSLLLESMKMVRDMCGYKS